VLVIKRRRHEVVRWAVRFRRPNLTTITFTPEWQVCSVGCNNSWTRAFTARLRPSASYTSTTPFTITATYSAYALINAHPPALTDHIRRGREGVCSSGYCDQPPGITPTPGVVYTGTTGTNTGPFQNWFIGKFQPPAPAPTGNLAFDVMVGYDPAACKGRSDYFNGNDVTIGFRGTLTITMSPDANQWTHYTIPFDISTPWMTTPNSNFCN